MVRAKVSQYLVLMVVSNSDDYKNKSILSTHDSKGKVILVTGRGGP
jgi:hypothetical protein